MSQKSAFHHQNYGHTSVLKEKTAHSVFFFSRFEFTFSVFLSSVQLAESQKNYKYIIGRKAIFLRFYLRISGFLLKNYNFYSK